MAEDRKDSVDILLQRIGPTFVALGSVVVIFYALGFIIVQSFIGSADVDGMFWFSRDYYEEAGGKFIVEIVRTPLVKPAFFLLFLSALIYLIPNDDFLAAIRMRTGLLGRLKRDVPFWQTIKPLMLLCLTILTYFFMGNFDALTGNNFVVNKLMPVLFWPGDAEDGQTKTLLFFSLTVPVTVSFGLFLRRLYKGTKNSGQFKAALSLFILFVSILPLSYGRYLYDIKAVPINDPKRMYALSNIQTDIPETSKMWFLGRFGGKYLFLRKDNMGIAKKMTDLANVSVGRTHGIVESLNESDVKHMNFTLDRADSLREIMKSSKKGAFESDALKVYDEIFK